MDEESYLEPIIGRLYGRPDGAQGRGVVIFPSTSLLLRDEDSSIVVECDDSPQWFLLSVQGLNGGGTLVFEMCDNDNEAWYICSCIVSSSVPGRTSILQYNGDYTLFYTGGRRMRIRKVSSDGYEVVVNIQRTPPQPAVPMELPEPIEELMQRVTVPRVATNSAGRRELQYFLEVLNVGPDDVLWFKAEDNQAEGIHQSIVSLWEMLPHRNAMLVTPPNVGINSLSDEDMRELGWERIQQDSSQPPEEESLEQRFNREPLMLEVMQITRDYMMGGLRHDQWIRRMVDARDRLVSITVPNGNVRIDAMDRTASINVVQRDPAEIRINGINVNVGDTVHLDDEGNAIFTFPVSTTGPNRNGTDTVDAIRELMLQHTGNQPPRISEIRRNTWVDSDDHLRVSDREGDPDPFSE